jgi:hypothetical protein
LPRYGCLRCARKGCRGSLEVCPLCSETGRSGSPPKIAAVAQAESSATPLRTSAGTGSYKVRLNRPRDCK